MVTWEARASSQRVWVGWRSSWRGTSCTRISLETPHLRSLPVPSVERVWAVDMHWSCTQPSTRGSGRIFACFALKTSEGKKSWSTMKEVTPVKSSTNATYVERHVWMLRIWRNMRKLTLWKIFQELKQMGISFTQSCNPNCSTKVYHNYDFKCHQGNTISIIHSLYVITKLLEI